MTPKRPATPDALETLEAIVGRTCRVRRFLDDPVPREDVEHLVALTTCAASPCNTRAWRFIAVRSREIITAMQTAILERFDELADRPGLALQERKRVVARAEALFFAKAPLCVAVLAVPVASPMEELARLAAMSPEERDRLCAHPDIQSVGAAVQLLTTAAHTLGYGACWTCAPIIAKDRLEALLEVAPPARLVALVPIGRPAGPPEIARRLPVDQVLSYR